MARWGFADNQRAFPRSIREFEDFMPDRPVCHGDPLPYPVGNCVGKRTIRQEVLLDNWINMLRSVPSLLWTSPAMYSFR